MWLLQLKVTYFVFNYTMQFFNSSLVMLINNFPDNGFKHLLQEFSGDLLKLIKQKGVYAYECMDSFKKFFDDKLPDASKYFSSLKDECISEKDYLHANNLWNLFKVNTMGDYHKLYSKIDVFLLSDTVETFISTCLEYYGLYP